ncbi:MAG: acyl carrier protein [Acidobacteriota bacterium]|nr:acyl carrier protein [Acidobacteriota bacterium]
MQTPTEEPEVHAHRTVTDREIQDLVLGQLRRGLPPGVTLGAETDFDELGLSSLQLVDIVTALEERHGFRFDPAVIEARTLGDLVRLANEALGAGPADR